MAKERMTIQEKYRKGVIIDKNKVSDLIKDNFDKIEIELRERSVYPGSEEIMIVIRIKSK
jgi:hypothetical protein